MGQRPKGTQTSRFGAGRRESHDAAEFYKRFTPPELSEDETVNRPPELIDTLGDGTCLLGSSLDMGTLPDNSVALVVTSPPYFVGKEYELAVTGELDPTNRVPASYVEYLEMLRSVFAECRRVLEPGGRIAVNVANLGRKPYRSLSADVVAILQDDLGLLLRGEVIWEKSAASGGSCAWGSFARASNPVLRDVTERVVVASKGRFARAVSVAERRRRGLPWESTLTNDEFVDVTRDVWRIDAESAKRIGHPAPFPVELPQRLIELYTYRSDIVVDPFLGSGTTVVAAARTGRIGVGFDTDPAYVALAEERLAAELTRVRRLDRALPTHPGAPAPPEPAPAVTVPSEPAPDELSPDERVELLHRLALAAGSNSADIARRTLEEAGFTVTDKARVRGGALTIDMRATTPSGSPWWIEVPGGFTTNRPGLLRTDLVWRLLGRLTVLRSVVPDARVLVLTAALPRPGSEGDRALRAAGPALLFDVIELLDPNGAQRLAAYADAIHTTPLPGFWTTADDTAAPTGD